jgi:hypothetical protein
MPKGPLAPEGDVAETYRLGVMRRAVNVLMGAGVRAGLAPKRTWLLTVRDGRAGKCSRRR